VFRRRSAGATDGTAQESPGAQSQGTPADERPTAEAGKGRPTRKRSEAERGRYQSIAGGPARPGAAGRTGAPRTAGDKARDRSERNRKYEAMKRGEEWALNPRDRGPGRALARDYIDAKRRPSEYYMYVLVILLVALLSRSKALETYVSPFVLVLIAIVAIDAFFIRRGLRKLMAERLPGESMRGLTRYAVFRALQIRRFRIPAPRVKPGESF
jgi:hypothetical protein